MKVYLYKEYFDEDAYGEEIVEVYAKKDEAIQRLRERVEEKYGVPFSEIPEALGLAMDDTFQDDYVSIGNGDGAVSFWFVEEKEVMDGKNNMNEFYFEGYGYLKVDADNLPDALDKLLNVLADTDVDFTFTGGELRDCNGVQL